MIEKPVNDDASAQDEALTGEEFLRQVHEMISGALGEMVTALSHFGEQQADMNRRLIALERRSLIKARSDI